MADHEAEEQAEPRVEQQDDGSRVVTWSRTTASQGTTVTFQHDFPNAVVHHYRPASTDQDVLLYRGKFSDPGDDRCFEGDVRFRWRPSPRIDVRGERFTSAAGVSKFVEKTNSGAAEGMWGPPREVKIELYDGILPEQPQAPFVMQRTPGISTHTGPNAAKLEA